MKTVKEYAESKGVSHQAVYKQLQAHSEELEGLIVMKERTKYLTEEAMEILDRYSNQSPQIVERNDNKEIIESLRDEKESLLIKVAMQADKIAELAEQKAEQALLLAEANQKQLLLEEKSNRIAKLEADLHEARIQLEKLQAVLLAESSKSWLQKLFRK